jgi:ribonuclease P protein subunit POP4
MHIKNTLPQHEWIGLSVKIVDATDRYMIGIEGRIVDETKNMVVIEINDNVEKKVPKKGTVFEFTVNGEKIRLKGSECMFRPEDRVKRVWLRIRKRKRKY